MFQSVIFSGGGCRCFWQVGFFEAAAGVVGTPRFVAAVSAGAAMACAVFADIGTVVLEDFKHRAGKNIRNFHPGNWFRGAPAFPHESMYSSSIQNCISSETLSRLQSGPDIRVLIGLAPPWASAPVAVGLAGLLVAMRGVFPARAASWRFGFRPEVVSVRQCADVAALADLILCSSCTPPVLPTRRYQGRVAIDGGIVENVPRSLVPESECVLALATEPARRGRAELGIPGICHVAPSQPIGIAVWDYANPAGLQSAFDLGRHDGERFVSRWYRSSTEERAERLRSGTLGSFLGS